MRIVKSRVSDEDLPVVHNGVNVSKMTYCGDMDSEVFLDLSWFVVDDVYVALCHCGVFERNSFEMENEFIGTLKLGSDECWRII